MTPAIRVTIPRMGRICPCKAIVGSSVTTSIGVEGKAITTTSATASSHETSTPSVFRGHPANDDLMSLDGGETLHDQLLRWFLLVKGDKAEVLGGVVLGLVNWADNFDYRSKLCKVVCQVLVGEILCRQLAHINLALPHLSLLASCPLPLDHMRLLDTGGHQP